jgi:hypothetical protein
MFFLATRPSDFSFFFNQPNAVLTCVLVGAVVAPARTVTAK